MTKEEFLAMSLPYELYIQNGKEADKVVGIVGDSIMTLFRGHLDNVWHIDDAKPILRPLADLTKPITQRDYNNGEPFVPIVELEKLFNGFYFATNSFGLVIKRKHHEMYFGINDTIEISKKLLEWKFDIADLISKGEAIDVNTLEFNPYA